MSEFNLTPRSAGNPFEDENKAQYKSLVCAYENATGAWGDFTNEADADSALSSWELKFHKVGEVSNLGTWLHPLYRVQIWF